MHHRQNIERDPEYVRERIEATQNFGRKYLISVGLFAILITTMQGDFDRPRTICQFAVGFPRVD